MVPLPKESLRQALLTLAPRYEDEMTKEIELAVRISSVQNTIKTMPGQNSLEMRMISQFQVYQHFTHIQDSVMDLLWVKSGGNPMACFWFAYQLIV
jgi:hypothetical protein